MKKTLFLVIAIIVAFGCQQQNIQAPAVTEINAVEINDTKEPIENNTEIEKEEQISMIVDLGYLSIDPQELRIEKGTKVVWENTDEIKPVHNIVSTDGLFQSGKMFYGDTFIYIFEKSGTYKYIDLAYKEEDRDKYMGAIIVS